MPRYYAWWKRRKQIKRRLRETVFAQDYLLALAFDQSKYRQDDRYFTDPRAGVSPEVAQSTDFEEWEGFSTQNNAAAPTGWAKQGTHDDINYVTFANGLRFVSSGTFMAITGPIVPVSGSYQITYEYSAKSGANLILTGAIQGDISLSASVGVRSTITVSSIVGSSIGFKRGGACDHTLVHLSVKEVPATYTRAGAKSEINSGGSIIAYAANVPGITDEGYWARQAFTNLLTYSQQFSDPSWFVGSATSKTADTALAPDGSNTADGVSWLAGLSPNTKYIQKTWGGAAESQTYTVSCFVKSRTGSDQQFRLKATHQGVLDYYSGDMTATDTWQRFEFTRTYTSTVGGGIIAGITQDSLGSPTDLLIWQAQLVQGTVPGPIIATNGSPATVQEDNLSFNINPDGSALTDQDMLIFATGTPGEVVATFQRIFTLYDGSSTSNFISLAAGTSGWRAQIIAAGVTVYDVSEGSASALSETTVVLKRQSGGWRVGKLVGSTLTWFSALTTAAFPSSGLTTTAISKRTGVSEPFRGVIKGAHIKPGTFATDAEVIATIEETL